MCYLLIGDSPKVKVQLTVLYDIVSISIDIQKKYTFL